MASSSSNLLHSLFLQSQPSPTLKKTRHLKNHTKMSVFAKKRDVSGHTVDENMIVLRMRIHEMRMLESNYEPPSNWMDWEKRYYASYDVRICEMVGMLQSGLMNTRPGLALGLIALVVLSVPMSTLVVASNAMEIAKAVLSGMSH